jgi:hypothetical protein
MLCFTYALLMLEESEDGRHTRVDRRFTRALLALYSRFTHAEESEDGRCFTHALLMLYSCFTHALLMLYSLKAASTGCIRSVLLSLLALLVQKYK